MAASTNSWPDPVRIEGSHLIDSFSCGNEDLDRWLHAFAHHNDRMDTTRVFVLADDDRKVLGYFALTMASVPRTEAPEKMVKGMPGYPVGAVLITRLAVDSNYQRQGVGAHLLAHAVLQASRAGEAAAARLITVDAVDDAAKQFYARHGFQAFPEHSSRLYIRLKDAVASLAEVTEA